jgi:VanZ family protein
MRKRFLLVLWLIGIIFPMAWLGRFSSRYHEVFNTIFSPEWMHWVMHAALYTGLVVLVMFNLGLPPGLKTLGWVLLITLGVGIIQEGLQLLSAGQTLRLNAVVDLGVDGIGALIGFGLYYVYRNYLTTH